MRSVLCSDVGGDVSRDSPVIGGTVHSESACLSVCTSLRLHWQLYRFLRVSNCTNKSAVDRDCICFCACAVVELRDTATYKLFLLSSLQSIKLLIINIRA